MIKQFNFIVGLIILLSVFVPGQEVILNYSKVDPDPFANESYPVLGFVPSNPQDSALIEFLYSSMRNQTDITNKFSLISFANIVNAKKNLKLKKISFDDLNSLKSISSVLGIKFIVSLSSTADGLNLLIKNSNDGILVYQNDYMNSDSSTAIEDLLKFFSHGMRATYIKQGALNITITNNKYALLKIDQKEDSFPYSKNLPPGKYMLNISSEGYYPIDEQIDIRAGQTVSKTYRMDEAYGRVNISVSPPNVQTKFIRNRDSLEVYQFNGSIEENRIQEGLYYLESSALGFAQQNNYLFRVIADTINTNTIDLKRAFFTIEKISSNAIPQPLWEVKIIPGEKIYKLIYSLAGEPDDTYDVNVWLVRKDGKDIVEFPLKGLSGDIGEDILAGSEKIIEWEVNTDFPKNIQSNEYSFYIEVD